MWDGVRVDVPALRDAKMITAAEANYLDLSGWSLIEVLGKVTCVQVVSHDDL